MQTKKLNSPTTAEPLNPSLLADFLASKEPITIERLETLLSQSSDGQTPDVAAGDVDDFLETLLEVIQ